MANNPEQLANIPSDQDPQCLILCNLLYTSYISQCLINKSSKVHTVSTNNADPDLWFVIALPLP